MARLDTLDVRAIVVATMTAERYLDLVINSSCRSCRLFGLLHVILISPAKAFLIYINHGTPNAGRQIICAKLLNTVRLLRIHSIAGPRTTVNGDIPSIHRVNAHLDRPQMSRAVPRIEWPSMRSKVTAS
jgi:hypothetical protein